MVYGIGTRSFNRSTENRQNKLAMKSVTAAYLAGELKIDPTMQIVCRCRSWQFDHYLVAHNQLKSDHDWRLPEERK